MKTITVGHSVIPEHHLIVNVLLYGVRVIRPEVIEDSIRFPSQEIRITDDELKEILTLVEKERGLFG